MVTTEAAKAITSSNDPKIKLPRVSTRRTDSFLGVGGRYRGNVGLKKWPPNALRHSFASYHLAAFDNAAKLALELGHTSEELIFRHYRELVRPEQATKYWAIRSWAGNERGGHADLRMLRRHLGATPVAIDARGLRWKRA